MKSSCFVFTLISTIVAQDLNSNRNISLIEDARSDQIFGRVINGLPATANQFPFQVSLVIIPTIRAYFVCGGSLISNSWVLTAAHCLFTHKYVFVSMGSLNTTTPEMVIESSAFFLHPLFNRSNLNNDIALIKLNRNIPRSANIRPVRLTRLSSIGTETWEGHVATVSGWGYTNDPKNGGILPETLRYVSLSVISNEKCRQVFATFLVPDSVVCAQGQGIQNPCIGDSGGALVVREEDGELTQVGIVSYLSTRGCSVASPSAYTRPEYYLDWIAQYATDIDVRF